ncbi:MAG: hypothetical protein KF690_09915 [Bacteroidetes bacterium]|nr:hypothetical protein [Bacteroidota bacterium]
MLILPLWGFGQSGVFVTKYIPGNYLANNVHEVELTNEGPRPENIGGWFVVTRDYGVRIPAGTILAPGARYRMAKSPEGHARLNLELRTTPDFLIRLPDRRYEGNYIVLMNASRQPVQGFYHSTQSNPPFLPDSGHFLVEGRRMLSFSIPAFTHRLWTYFPIGEDPAIGFERISGSWRVISATRPLNLYPAAAFIDVKGRYHSGTVTLRWNTAFEDRLAEIGVERSVNQKDFVGIARVKPVAGTSNQMHAYVYPDSRLPEGDSVLYYRLVARDVAGMATESRMVQVLAREEPVEFLLEADPRRTPSSRNIGIRFFSAHSQYVNILLLDAQGKLVALLFDGLVYADTQRLLSLQVDLPAGIYTVLASTDERRYWQKFSIESSP